MNKLGIRAGAGGVGKDYRLVQNFGAGRSREWGSGWGCVMETGACKPQAKQPRLSSGVRGPLAGLGREEEVAG